ncbi:hypothetical protein D1007_55625 [Hordeum vulgare]|nr:hypothetical protein D1007_55625 [Hordeum vulgare]
MDGAACDPDPGDLEPPRTALAPTKVNSGANEDMQDICIGSQEALFMEGRESCSNDTDNGQTNDGGEPLLQLHQTKTGGINENNKTSHEDLCMLDDFVEDQDNSPVQLEDLDAQTTTFHDILLDPWKPTLFDDILLDQVDRNNEGTRGAFEREQNHTWNLDSPTYVDDGSSRESREAGTSTNACCLQVPNSENENNDINEETIDEFLENERRAAEGGNDRSIDSELKPKMGMQFSMREEAQKFLNFYAFVAGFSISVVSTARTTSKKRNGEVKGVGAQFSMTSFLREYQRILDNIHANEDELDHNATHKKVSWKTFTTKYYIERQAHNMYNISIFRKFQIILNDVTRLQIREEESMKLYMVYQAKNYYKQEHMARLYVVQVDADRDDYSCICCKFEKDGILCCHILKVMLHLEVDKIPDKYIIDRWIKEGKKMNKPKAIPLKLDNDQLRYNVLGMKLMELGSNASKSQRKFEHLLSVMVRIQQDLIDMDMEGEDEVDEQGEQTEECSKSNRTIGTLTAMVQSGNSNSTVELLNPDKAHTKGRPRLMTIQERIKTKTFYKCSHCHDPTHTKRKCTNLDKVYEFPKKKRSRKANQTKTADAGRNYSGSGNNKETITNNLPIDMNIQVHQ